MEGMVADDQCFSLLWSHLGLNNSLDGFEERYCGEWRCEEDFTRHIMESCYDLESRMGDLQHYFDYEAYGRDLFIDDYQMGSNGHVFRRY